MSQKNGQMINDYDDNNDDIWPQTVYGVHVNKMNE